MKDIYGQTIKIGDTIGNTVEGFNWEVIKFNGNYIEVKHTSSKKIKNTFFDNMYK